MSANLVFCSHNIFNSLELIRSLTSQFLSVKIDKDGTSPCRICILHNYDEINLCGQVPILPVNSPSVICQQLKKRGVTNFAGYTVTPCPACTVPTSPAYTVPTSPAYTVITSPADTVRRVSRNKQSETSYCIRRLRKENKTGK